MAYAKPRSNGRFSAVYVLPTGTEKSAGTFDTEAEALDVATRQQAWVCAGQRGVGPADRATITVAEYFPHWLAQHPVELSTKSGYRDIYNARIRDWLGHNRLADVEREAIRGLISQVRSEGRGRATQKAIRSVLSAMFTTAVDDGYRSDNPAAGIRLPRSNAGTKKREVFDYDQYSLFRQALPTKGARLLSSVIIETGCRPSEAFVLTLADVELGSTTIHFSKALQGIDREDSKDGGRWLVAGTKTHDRRSLVVTANLAKAVHEWATENGMDDNDLLFPARLVVERPRSRAVRYDLTEEFIATLGTIVGPNGKAYRHGTMNAYVTGKCRDCDYCRQAMTDYCYERNGRLRAGSEPERATGFVTRETWRSVFRRALREAGLPERLDPYTLRHTHASWLINKGEDPKTVSARLGHTSMRTTEIYVKVMGVGETSAAIMDDLGLSYD